MYYARIETDRAAKVEHDNSLKKNSADRLKANADWNKKNRPSKKKDR